MLQMCSRSMLGQMDLWPAVVKWRSKAFCHLLTARRIASGRAAWSPCTRLQIVCSPADCDWLGRLQRKSIAAAARQTAAISSPPLLSVWWKRAEEMSVFLSLWLCPLALSLKATIFCLTFIMRAVRLLRFCLGKCSHFAPVIKSTLRKGSQRKLCQWQILFKQNKRIPAYSHEGAYIRAPFTVFNQKSTLVKGLKLSPEHSGGLSTYKVVQPAKLLWKRKS